MKSKSIGNKLIKNFLPNEQKVHFIGIGGSGMIGLVEIVNQLGVKITGSDVNESDPVKLAQSLGIDVSLNQVAQNINDPDLIVYTSAVLANNPELLKAQTSKIPLVERSELLGALTNCFSRCVNVSGTHGKTTTTSMVVEILKHSGIDLSFIIGGKLKSANCYGKLGADDLIVCEACEFANHFLKLKSTHSVILNIEPDHMEFFKTLDNLKNSFIQFCNQTSNCVVYCGDDEVILDVVKRSNLQDKQSFSFGFKSNNDFIATNIEQLEANHFKFNIKCFNKPVDEVFEFFAAGEHNVLNALAAIAVCFSFGINFKTIAEGLRKFKGVKRRFDFIGKVKGITVVDDYAHHPSEIMATLKAAKNFGFRKIWAIHQPFTYSRTRMFLDSFAEALEIADRVVLTKILGSREENIYQIKSEHLAKKIKGSVVCQTQEEAAKFVLDNACPGDLAITLGCGDIYKCAQIMVNGYY